MKSIVMTTKLPEPITMGDAGVFETGKARDNIDDALADQLLKRQFPKFKEVKGGSENG